MKDEMCATFNQPATPGLSYALRTFSYDGVPFREYTIPVEYTRMALLANGETARCVVMSHEFKRFPEYPGCLPTLNRTMYPLFKGAPETPPESISAKKKYAEKSNVVALLKFSGSDENGDASQWTFTVFLSFSEAEHFEPVYPSGNIIERAIERIMINTKSGFSK